MRGDNQHLEQIRWNVQVFWRDVSCPAFTKHLEAAVCRRDNIGERSLLRIISGDRAGEAAEETGLFLSY